MDIVNGRGLFWRHSKRSNSRTMPLWREMSLFLVNMGHAKGLRSHKPALFCPHPRLLWIGSLTGHCASWGDWCIFNEVT